MEMNGRINSLNVSDGFILSRQIVANKNDKSSSLCLRVICPRYVRGQINASTRFMQVTNWNY